MATLQKSSSQYMFYVFVLILQFMTLQNPINGECIYSTMTGYIYPYGVVNERYIVDDFNGDCELLCYRSSSCVGANVRRLRNGSVICEFK
ncbi:hypothetical protein LSH36_1228g00054 [Paralvinella palmiformis]|uniref:Uncharacterized protein n=1 Tax=Paralvinella palmiformis TaxID=53620 RepID=A0AAD9IU14_9ANNE|nr:hypothetical protein LSH36_1228g00054 [Paralvinella palmiformis]